ncbi:hypothetical protein BH10PSE2_BH10PSE2_14170 [soil metagenome]
MRAAVLIAGGLVALGLCGLGACSAEPKMAAPKPSRPVAVVAPVSDVAVVPTGPPSPVDLRRVCRAGLAAIHGQETTAIQITGVSGDVVDAQWPAPVDGGLLKVQCRVTGAVLTWKPLGLPDPLDERWMNQAGDPVNTIVLKGDVVTVTQTDPDGTKQVSDQTVPANKEAA